MLTYYVSPRARWARPARFEGSRQPEVYIPVDVIAEGDEYVLSAFVPGVAAEDVRIEVLDDTISIRGEFPAQEDEEARFLLRERPTGGFSRTLRMPTPLDASQAKAETSNGVLTLRVPKAEHAKAKKIEIKTK